MDLEDIVPSEIRPQKTNTVWYHLYVESKESQTHKNWVWNSSYQGLGDGKIGEMVFKGINLELIDKYALEI